MTYSEPTPEQETTGQDPEQETTGQDPEQETTGEGGAGSVAGSGAQDAAESSQEPGKNQGDPLFAQTQDGQPDAGAGTATSASA
jgi:hypothetical protein